MSRCMSARHTRRRENTMRRRFSERGERRNAMFVNCYDGYGLCLFAVRVKEGVEAEDLGDHICNEHDLIDYWYVADDPEGAVVRY